MLKKDLNKKNKLNGRYNLTGARVGMKLPYPISKLGFGSLLMLMSVSLILCIGLYIVLKLSYGVDLPYVSFSFAQHSDKLGQFGDFFGGVLNPLLSFMALLGVLYTIRTQGKELKEAREENRIANKIQDKQSAIFERQNFESVFFRLVDVHASMAERVRDKLSHQGVNGFELAVQETLNEYFYIRENIDHAERTKPKPQYELLDLEKVSDIKLLQEAFAYGVQGQARVMLSQYYRNIYQILKLVDGFKLFAGEEQISRKDSRQVRLEYFHKRQYSNILRAQLSDDELKLMFFNCITPYGAGLKTYVEQYSLLKHMQRDGFLGNKQELMALYDDTAYADYEDISLSKIMEFSGARIRSKIKNMFNHKAV